MPYVMYIYFAHLEIAARGKKSNTHKKPQKQIDNKSKPTNQQEGMSLMSPQITLSSISSQEVYLVEIVFKRLSYQLEQKTFLSVKMYFF